MSKPVMKRCLNCHHCPVTDRQWAGEAIQCLKDGVTITYPDLFVCFAWAASSAFANRMPQPCYPTPAKPPVGLRPEWLWLEHREDEIVVAVSRYIEAGVPVPMEWLEHWIRIQQLLAQRARPKQEVK